MSEFKLTGAGYVSEWNGNSANAGTVTSPKKHPSDAGMPGSFTDIIVIGAGYYKGSIPGGTPARRWHGDGKVIIDLNNGFIGAIAQNPQVDWRNIHFKNGIINNQAAAYTMFNCIMENCSSIRFRSQSIIENCTILNDTENPDSTGASRVNGCLFLGSISTFQLGGGIPFYSNFLAQGKSIILGNFATRVNFRSNILNGIIIVSGIQYELKYLIGMIPRPDANPNILDLASIWSDVYTRNNFAGDPKFIDVLNKVVDPESDLLKIFDGTFVGSVKAARAILVNSLSSDVTVETLRINTSDPANFLIQSGQVDGEIIITWKTEQITEVQNILLNSIVTFDGSVAGGTAGNNNVPDIFPTNYTPLSSPGLKPNRLTYGLRTSRSIEKPISDSEWDNDNAILGTTIGEFYIQEWDSKPTIHTSLGIRYGNGRVESIGISGNGINARWRQVKVRLTNLRSFL